TYDKRSKCAPDFGPRQSFQATYSGLLMSFAGSAPRMGRNFCTRPAETSATYRFPSWSTPNWCTPQNPPGASPWKPNEYWNFPFRSHFTIFQVPESAAHKYLWSAPM